MPLWPYMPPHAFRSGAKAMFRDGQGETGGQGWPSDNDCKLCSSIALQMSVATKYFRVANHKFFSSEYFSPHQFKMLSPPLGAVRGAHPPYVSEACFPIYAPKCQQNVKKVQKFNLSSGIRVKNGYAAGACAAGAIFIYNTKKNCHKTYKLTL